MDLILWRHAEAEDTAEGGDIKRALTARGHKQARRVAAWLDRQLPEGARILCSPALRCQQTADALGRKYKTCRELTPDAATPDALLEAADWPGGKPVTLLVGHQPTLGQVIARLIGWNSTGAAYPMRKGALWWLRARERDGERQILVVSVQTPEMM